MAKATIYIPGMKLKKIDLYCQEKKINRSELMTNCTLSFINSHSAQKIICGKCKRNSAIGKYNVTVYDWDQGDSDQELNLCQFCLNKAKQEGVSIKEI